MYCVRYTQLEVGSSFRPVFFQSSNLTDACQVAINLHRASNVAHTVTVSQESEEPKIFRECLFLTTLADLTDQVYTDGYGEA